MQWPTLERRLIWEHGRNSGTRAELLREARFHQTYPKLFEGKDGYERARGKLLAIERLEKLVNEGLLGQNFGPTNLF
jgi:hypothetical protein